MIGQFLKLSEQAKASMKWKSPIDKDALQNIQDVQGKAPFEFGKGNKSLFSPSEFVLLSTPLIRGKGCKKQNTAKGSGVKPNEVKGAQGNKGGGTGKKKGDHRV